MAPKRTLHLADPGPLVSRTHETSSGTRVRLRLTRPSDAPRVAEFLPEGADVERFTYFDPRRRLVLAATRPATGGEEVVGLGEVDFENGAQAIETDPQEGVDELLCGALDHLARSRAA